MRSESEQMCQCLILYQSVLQYAEEVSYECSVSHTPVLLVEINPQSGGKNQIPEEEAEKALKKDEQKSTQV